MIELSKEQYNVLKRFKKRTIPYNSLDNNEIEICEYLVSNRCLSAKFHSETGISFPRIKVDYYAITQRGKALLLEFQFKYHRWYIPLIVSILSLIISALSYINSLNL